MDDVVITKKNINKINKDEKVKNRKTNIKNRKNKFVNNGFEAKVKLKIEQKLDRYNK